MLNKSAKPTLIPSDPNGYEAVHRRRFDLTLAYLKHGLTEGRLLELGGEGAFTQRLRGAGYTVDLSEGDLRTAVHKGQYDGVLCCEVLEHIHDQNDKGIPTEWQGTGAKHMLKAAFDATKPGGHFLLTTPNADSLNVINKVIHRQATMVYRPHVREYTCHECTELVRQAGYEVLDVRTEEPWDNSMSPQWRRVIEQMLSSNLGRAGLLNRGEDIFLLARRPVV